MQIWADSEFVVFLIHITAKNVLFFYLIGVSVAKICRLLYKSNT